MSDHNLLEHLAPSMPGGHVVREAGVTLVEGSSEPWAYAAFSPIPGSGPAKVKGRVRLVAGNMSIGVLARSMAEFLIERVIPITKDYVWLELPIQDVGATGGLVLRTHAGGGAEPRLEVASLTVEHCPTILGAPAIDPIVENLWPLETAVYNIPAMSQWTHAELQRHLTGDLWKDNLILNKFEFASGVARLGSFPWRFSVPFVLCNARCEFCSAWLVKGKPMPIELIDRLDVVLPYLAEIDMVGWGEPLIHPEFGHILDTLKRRADRRARIALTTNGTNLGRWVNRLVETGVRDYAISVHAATAGTHEDLMGLPGGSFNEVVSGIRKLVSKRSAVPGMSVAMVFIVTRQNIEEIPQFIDLAEDLGVDLVFMRTLKSRTAEEQRRDGLDYQRLPPYLHPDFKKLRATAIEAIKEARIRIEANADSWSTKIFPSAVEAELLAQPLTSREVRRASRSFHRTGAADTSDLPVGQLADRGDDELHHEELENPYQRTAPMLCPSPYTALYINGFDRMVTPCCYMTTVPGYKKSYLRQGATFDDVWNSPAMVGLRESLHRGPLKQPCRKCAFYW